MKYILSILLAFVSINAFAQLPEDKFSPHFDEKKQHSPIFRMVTGVPKPDSIGLNKTYALDFSISKDNVQLCGFKKLEFTIDVVKKAACDDYEVILVLVRDTSAIFQDPILNLEYVIKQNDKVLFKDTHTVLQGVHRGSNVEYEKPQI